MPFVLGREPDRAVARREPAARCVVRVAEPPLVVRVRRERAELRPEPPRLREKDPAVGWHRLVIAEEVLEHRATRALGM